jgi:dihydroxy-acid dehydratase
LISVDVEKRSIELRVGPEELEQRRASLSCSTSASDTTPNSQRGYLSLHKKHVEQAHQGCDFDFLKGFTPLEKPRIF